MGVEGSKFSFADCLGRILSQINASTNISSLCELTRKELDSVMRCESLTCLRYKLDTKNFTIIGTTKTNPTPEKSLTVDDETDSWIKQQSFESIRIIDEYKTIPKSLSENLITCEDKPVIFYKNSEYENSVHIILLEGISSESTLAKEMNVELPEFLKVISVISESVLQMNEINIMRDNLQSVFDLAPVGIIICKSDGSVINANEHALSIFGGGLNKDTLVGENLIEGKTFKDNGIDSVIKRALSGEEVDVENLKFRSANGKTMFIHVKFRGTNTMDGKIQAIGVLVDMTQRMRLQQQLERSYRTLTDAYQELQRVDKMKTRFIDTVSHELRTPLTVMRGYLELIQSEYADKLDQKTMAKIKSIRANSDRLYDLVESMLDVARIEQGAMEIIKQEASVKNLIEDIVESQRGLAKDKHQELTIVFQGELSHFMIDIRKVRDALKNILNNAIRFTHEGGKIQVGAADEGKMIHIWIRDNGVGIPTSDLEKIFDRFHIVVAKELSHQVDRMGLGLPLAKGIVDAHKGKLWVESEVGKGSIFHIHLPKE